MVHGQLMSLQLFNVLNNCDCGGHVDYRFLRLPMDGPYEGRWHLRMDNHV